MKTFISGNPVLRFVIAILVYFLQNVEQDINPFFDITNLRYSSRDMKVIFMYEKLGLSNSSQS